MLSVLSAVPNKDGRRWSVAGWKNAGRTNPMWMEEAAGSRQMVSYDKRSQTWEGWDIWATPPLRYAILPGSRPQAVRTNKPNVLGA